MINVVEAISDGNIGGAGIVLLNRLRASDRTKYRTTVVLPRGSMLVPRLKKLAVEVVEIECRADRSFFIGDIPKLMSVIKRTDPQIINSHGWLSFRIAAFLKNVKIRIYTCLFPNKKFHSNALYKAIFSFGTNLLSHHVIAVADVVKKDLIAKGIEEKNISVVINGVPKVKTVGEKESLKLKRELCINENENVICISARLEKYKGHRCLLRAMKILRKKGIKVKCLILGDGRDRYELEKLSSLLGVERDVLFLGFVSDVAPYLNISHVNVNCSIGTETSSLALSEGMSLGLPAVVSDFGGNPHMVHNGENGFVFEQNNADELAEKILLLLTNKEIYDRQSKIAKKRYFEEFDSKIMTEKVEGLYWDFLKQKSEVLNLSKL